MITNWIKYSKVCYLMILTVMFCNACTKSTGESSAVEPNSVNSASKNNSKKVYPDYVKVAAKEFGPKIKIKVKDYNYHILEMKKIVKFYNENAPYFQEEWEEIQYGLHDVSNYYFGMVEKGQRIEEDHLIAGEEVLVYHKNVIEAAAK